MRCLQQPLLVNQRQLTAKERQTNCSHGEHIQCVSRGSDHFKVVLEDGDRAAQSLVATPTEQGHAHVEEDGGDEGGPGQAAHTSLAALLAA